MQITVSYIEPILLIVLAKYKSATRASHQPAFMGSCQTISHTMFPVYRVEEFILVFLVLLKEVGTLE